MSPSHKPTPTTMAKSKSKPGGIGAKGSAKARFFHPSQKIRNKWPNQHEIVRISDVMIVGKANHQLAMMDFVGTLPNGYIRSSPLPRLAVPRDSGVPTYRAQTACIHV